MRSAPGVRGSAPRRGGSGFRPPVFSTAVPRTVTVAFMRGDTLFVSFLVLAASGCATGIVLTDRGANVQAVGATEVPAGCVMLGDASVGIPPDAGRPSTEEELVYLIRNKAGESGATHVLIESRERRGSGEDVHYVGRARSYRCPASEPRTVDAPQAGGETDDDALLE